MEELKEVREEMADPPWLTIGDYCTRTDVGQMSLGFQLANPITFNIKNDVLSGLRDNPFDRKVIRGSWEHLAEFYETCPMC